MSTLAFGDVGVWICDVIGPIFLVLAVLNMLAPKGENDEAKIKENQAAVVASAAPVQGESMFTRLN